MPTWTNTLPRHFCRGPASHRPFDFLPSFYPFYMFLAAKTFSAFSTCPCRRVHNHYTKRILNLILNRKKFLRRRNETLRFRWGCPQLLSEPTDVGERRCYEEKRALWKVGARRPPQRTSTVAPTVTAHGKANQHSTGKASEPAASEPPLYIK